MANYTDYLQLSVTPESTNKTFKNWRLEIDNDTDSNMTKIDDAIKTIHDKLDGVAAGAEVNQNAFSNVKVGSTTVAADGKTDTLELAAGDNITLTPDATNDKITIAAKGTTYSSKAAASGGTDVSLVTTGEKYTWNSKAAGSHTHSADDVTDGTLPVARGGTGKTTTLEALTYLGGASIKSIGTAIDAGTDLNTLITAGTYYSSNADRSASLVNAPTTASGFKLFVVVSYQTGRIIQYAIIHWSIYVRYSDNATGASPSWSNWDSFSRNTHTHAAADITSGTLPAARGGTGQTTLIDAAYAMNEALTSSSTDVLDTTLFTTSSVGADTGKWYRRPATALWNYISGKADGTYYKLTTGIEITSNADLDDTAYRTPGNYYCSTNAAARTVKHTPGCDATTLVNPDLSAFLLRVGYAIGVSSYISQELRDFKTGVTYYRYYHSSSWTAWQAVSGSGSALLTEMNTTSATADVTDDTLIATSANTGETGTWYRRTAVKFWNYIKGKADAVYAAISHTHAAGDITSGTLPIARGGTGSTTAFAALTALGGASIASIGTTIAANTDLNTLTTPGTYYSLNSTRSQTMPNTPITDAGFKLIVLYTYDATKVMQLASSGATFYARYCNNTSAATPTWTAWVKWSTSDHTHAAVDITSGTLPVARGGTGQTTATAAASALIYALTEVTSTAASANVTDDTLIATSAAAGDNGTWYRRSALRMWNYYKGKADAVYSAIGHTHTVPSLGGGYATCTTAAGTFAKTASLSGYTLKAGGIVVVKFTKGSTCVVSDTNPDVTLNINGTGAKPIMYRNVALDNDTIKANNYITFVYDGASYNLISSSRGVANTFKGATSSEAGSIGIVPQPPAGANVKYLCGDGTWAVPTTQSSDARLKDVQGEIPDISGVRAVRFKWKDGHGDDKEHIGYLAQDVELVAPFLVGEDSSGYKNLDYLALLCAKVEMLERRVAELEAGQATS